MNRIKHGERKKKGYLWILLMAFAVIAVFVVVFLFQKEKRQSPIFTIKPGDADLYIDDGLYGSDIDADQIGVNALGMDYIKNELLVTAKIETSKEEMEELLYSVKGGVVGYIEAANHYQVRFDSNITWSQLREMKGMLEDSEIIDRVWYHYIGDIEISGLSKDGAEIEAPVDIDHWALNAVQAPEAWEYFDDMQPVNVGVFDARFQNHKDLEFAESPWINVSGDKNLFGPDQTADFEEDNEEDPTKSYNHGNHVSGIIAGNYSEKHKTRGIAPNSRLYAASGNGMTYILKQAQRKMSYTFFSNQLAMTYLIIQKDVKVINISIGDESQFALAAARGNELIMEMLQDRADQLSEILSRYIADEDGGNAGTNHREFVICVAAGNDGIFRADKAWPDYRCTLMDSYEEYLQALQPDTDDISKEESEEYNQYSWFINDKEGDYSGTYGSYSMYSMIRDPKVRDRIVIVGAVKQGKDGTYGIADFSQWGPNVDILAPGENILSTMSNDEYGYMSGTSMASPYVAGVAVLAFGLDPDLSGAQVKKIILDTATGSYHSANPLQKGAADVADAAIDAAAELAGEDTGEENGDEKERALKMVNAYNVVLKVYNDRYGTSSGEVTWFKEPYLEADDIQPSFNLSYAAFRHGCDPREQNTYDNIANVSRVMQNDKEGLIDYDGEIRLEPDYTAIVYDSQNSYSLTAREPSGFGGKLIDSEYGLTEEDYFAYDQHKGYWYSTTTDKLYRYSHGSSAEFFLEGIESIDEMVPVFAFGEDLDNVGGVMGMDEKTDRLYADFTSGEAKMGIYFRNGLLVSCEYDFVHVSSEGICAALKNDKWYYINEAGEVINEKGFDGANEMGRDKDHLYTSNLQNIFNCFYAYDYSEGLVAVNQNGLWGYMNKMGEQVIRCQLEEARPVRHGKAWAKQNGKWGILDLSAYAAEKENTEIEEGEPEPQVNYEALYDAYLNSDAWKQDIFDRGSTWSPTGNPPANGLDYFAGYTLITKQLLDIDGDEIPELLFNMQDQRSSGPRGYETMTGFCAIKDGAVVMELCGYRSSGTIGGRYLTFAYDLSYDQYVVAVNGWAGGFGGSSASYEYYRYDGSVEIVASASVLVQPENSITIPVEPPFDQKDGRIIVYTVGDSQTSQEEYESILSRFQDMAEE